MIFSILSALFWSLFDVIRKELAKELNPKFLSIIMSLSVLPIFLIGWLLDGAPIPQHSYYLPATISGFLAAIGSYCFINALSKGKLTVILTITAITPFISSIAAYVLLAEPLTLPEWLSVAVVVIASWLLLGGRFERSSNYMYLALVTAFAWGTCIVFDKSALQSGSASFHGLYMTSLIVISLSILLRPSFEWKQLFRHSKVWLVGVFAFFSAVILQFAALETLNPGIVETIKRGVGIICAVIVGRFLYKELLLLRQYVAVLLIFFASVMLL